MQPTTVLQPASKTKKHKKRNAPILHLQAFKANPMPLEILKPKPYPVSPPRTGLCRRAGGSRGRHVFNKIRPWIFGGSRFEGFWALSRTWGKLAEPLRSVLPGHGPGAPRPSVIVRKPCRKPTGPGAAVQRGMTASGAAEGSRSTKRGFREGSDSAKAQVPNQT